MNPPEFFLKAGLEGNSLVAQIPIYGGVTRSWQNPPGWGFLVSELQSTLFIHNHNSSSPTL